MQKPFTPITLTGMLPREKRKIKQTIVNPDNIRLTIIPIDMGLKELLTGTVKRPKSKYQITL